MRKFAFICKGKINIVLHVHVHLFFRVHPFEQLTLKKPMGRNMFYNFNRSFCKKICIPIFFQFVFIYIQNHYLKHLILLVKGIRLLSLNLFISILHPPGSSKITREQKNDNKHWNQLPPMWLFYKASITADKS